MENRIAQIGIIVHDREASEKINKLLHEFGDYIVGRMGIPIKQRNISVISIVLDAPSDVVNSLCGKIGAVSNVTAKAIYSKE